MVIFVQVVPSKDFCQAYRIPVEFVVRPETESVNAVPGHAVEVLELIVPALTVLQLFSCDNSVKLNSSIRVPLVEELGELF